MTFPSFFHFPYFLLFLSLFLHLKLTLLSQAFAKCNDVSLCYVLVFIVSLTGFKNHPGDCGTLQGVPMRVFPEGGL